MSRLQTLFRPLTPVSHETMHWQRAWISPKSISLITLKQPAKLGLFANVKSVTGRKEPTVNVKREMPSTDESSVGAGTAEARGDLRIFTEDGCAQIAK